MATKKKTTPAKKPTTKRKKAPAKKAGKPKLTVKKGSNINTKKAERFAAEAEEAKAQEAAAIQAVLRELAEWLDNVLRQGKACHLCPACGRFVLRDGHEDGCRLGAMLDSVS